MHSHTVRFLCGVSVNFIMDLFQQVLQISRIGGRNTKDCAHKVLDRYLHEHVRIGDVYTVVLISLHTHAKVD